MANIKKRKALSPFEKRVMNLLLANAALAVGGGAAHSIEVSRVFEILGEDRRRLAMLKKALKKLSTTYITLRVGTKDNCYLKNRSRLLERWGVDEKDLLKYQCSPSLGRILFIGPEAPIASVGGEE